MQSPRNLCLAVTAVLALTVVCGCASWSDRSTRDDQSTANQPTRAGRKSFVLQTRFVPIEVDPTAPDRLQSLWQWTDETIIPSEQRQSLLDNGLRIGRITQVDRFESKLSELSSHHGVDNVDTFLKSAAVSADNPIGNIRTPMVLGRRVELPVHLPIDGTVTPLVTINDQLIGKTLSNPQYLFAMTASRASSVRKIDLHIVPEIQHGQMLQRWVGSDSAMRIDTRRDAWTLTELGFLLTGGENASFVIGETTPRRGLGKEMLSGENAGRVQQQVILVLSLHNIPTPADLIENLSENL